MILKDHGVDTAIKFIVDGQNIEKNLALIKRVLGNVEMLLISVNNGRLRMVANEGPRYMYIGIPNNKNKLEGEGLFAVKAEALLGISKRRRQMLFSYKNNKCSFKGSGGYCGELTVLPVTDAFIGVVNEIFDTGKKNSGETLTHELLQEIQDGLKRCRLSDIYNKDKSLLRHLCLRGGQLQISSGDGYHIGVYRKSLPDSKLNLDLSLDDNYFKLINGTLKGDVSLTLSDDIFRVTDKKSDVEIIFPPFQEREDEVIKPDTVEAYLEDIEQEKDIRTEFNVRQTEIQELITNVKGIHATGARMSLEIRESDIVASVMTDNGRLKDVLDVGDRNINGDACSFNIDPEVLGDSFSCFDGVLTVEIGFSQGKNSEPRVYIVKPAKNRKLDYFQVHIGSTT